MDVFQNHDGVINHNADGEHETEHGEIVQRVAHGANQHEGRDDGGWNRDAGDHRAAPIVKERKRGQRHEHRPEQKVQIDFLQRTLDKTRLVADDLQLEVRRHDCFQFLHPFLDAVNHLHRVAAGLLAHDERDAFMAVGGRKGAWFFDGILDARNVF